MRDFEGALRGWTDVEERALLPAILRAGIPGRDPARELRLEYVQIRELTRYTLEQVGRGGALGDILGLVENLERRLAAHEAEMERVYYPAAAPVLSDAERRTLAAGAPPP